MQRDIKVQPKLPRMLSAFEDVDITVCASKAEQFGYLSMNAYDGEEEWHIVSALLNRAELMALAKAAVDAVLTLDGKETKYELQQRA